MSAPRMIQILRCDCGACTAGRWKSAYFWRCRECLRESVGDPTLAAAADAGRAHLAEHHAQGYCRLHGVHRSVCGCRVASVDPDALGGRENGSCDFPCCCGGTCNPIQHNLRREPG